MHSRLWQLVYSRRIKQELQSSGKLSNQSLDIGLSSYIFPKYLCCYTASAAFPIAVKAQIP
eukprot:6332100-Amphidinium_carterae.1